MTGVLPDRDGGSPVKKLTIDRDFQAAAGRMLKNALEFRRQVKVAIEDEIEHALDTR